MSKTHYDSCLLVHFSVCHALCTVNNGLVKSDNHVMIEHVLYVID